MHNMDYYALPQALYSYAGVKHLLSHGNNAILHKTLTHDVVDAEALMASHCIVYVVDGDVQVNTYEGEEIHISNGEMLFMPRDSYVISDYKRHREKLEVFLLFFDHDIATTFLAKQKSNTTTSSHEVCLLTPSQNVISYLEAIRTLALHNHHDKELLTLKLLEFLYLVAENDKDILLSTLYHSEAKKQKRDIFTLMTEHFDKNLSVEDFAALSGKSLSTLNREFKQKCNTTPKQWLIEKKIEKAHDLLSHGVTVTEVAFEVGYHNVSGFIKAYKSIYKQTPKTMQMSL